MEALKKKLAGSGIRLDVRPGLWVRWRCNDGGEVVEGGCGFYHWVLMKLFFLCAQRLHAVRPILVA